MGDGPLEIAAKQYTRHLTEMQGVLPTEVLELPTLWAVDDGLVVEVRHERKQGILTLVLRCGDYTKGYYDLVLSYEDASLTPTHERTLAKIARTTKTHLRHDFDLAFHEVDRTEEGKIEHRMLFHPGIWFSIRCTTLRWEQIPRPDRRLPRLWERFPNAPVVPPRRRLLRYR
jgi:hypothetical protein